MGYKFIIDVQGATLKGSKSYPSGSEAAHAASSVISQLGGSGTIKITSDFPDIGNWKPDAAEAWFLTGVKHDDPTGVIGFIMRKAGCTHDQAKEYFERHFS